MTHELDISANYRGAINHRYWVASQQYHVPVGTFQLAGAFSQAFGLSLYLTLCLRELTAMEAIDLSAERARKI